MTPSESDMLTQAIERNCAAVLSLPSAGMVRYYKTRFLRSVDQRVWLESVPEEQVLINSLIEQGQLVDVSFKMGTKRGSFSSPIYLIDSSYKFFATDQAVQAIQMVRPMAVKAVQRRTHYRVPVRETDNFKIDLWRILEQAYLNDQPPDLTYMPAIVQNLSEGGVGVMFKTRPLLVPDQRIRVILYHGNAAPMLIEGRSGAVRPVKSGKTFEAGIQFQHLQDSLAGRKILTDLTRIVSNLQLQEARRLRALAG